MHNESLPYERTRLDPLTVYVVDDSKDAADSLATLLTLLGHRARACYGGEQALALVQRERPDCVMLDVAMGDMDGLELARRLRERFGDDVILVAVTGSPPENPTVQAAFRTVDHYFQKPVTLEHMRKLFPS